MKNLGIKRHGTTKTRDNYRVQLADVKGRRAQRWQDIIEEARSGRDFEKAGAFIKKLNAFYGLRPRTFHNILPTVGRSVLAQRLANTLTYSGTIDDCALGTGNTSPTNADTALDTEDYRNLAASLTYEDEVAYITGFFTASEVTGTFAEVGFFIDGDGVGPDTGVLFSRSLISVTKTGVQTLTIDASFTFS